MIKNLLGTHIRIFQLLRKSPFLLLPVFLFGGQSLEKDLAYRMVLDNLVGSEIPDEFVRKAFTHEDVKIHMEIPKRFAHPYLGVRRRR